MAMFIELTPKDWFMMRVGLIFQEGDPDPEDAWVRSYLSEQQLVPRHQVQEERNGVPCEVLYFGQCYLGRHLHALQNLYQRGVERSLLVEKLRELRRSHSESSIDWPVGLDDHTFETLLPALAEALHEQASFGTDDEGYFTLTLDSTLIAGALTRALTTPLETTPPFPS
jgi:hypothetical protein